MRSKKLVANTVTSLLREVVMIISNFILPRLILSYYGSEVNGLVNSITQFLHVITFLDLGVGAVVQSVLYKPLATGNKIEIDQIVTSATKFFRRIGRILLGYIVILMIIYPYIAEQKFDHIYTAILIFAMSISTLSQYYLGVVDSLLLTADQRGYIQYLGQIGAIITVTITSVIIIFCGGSIQWVKLVTSFIYLGRASVIRLYVNKKYNVNRSAYYKTEPIKQKWNGLAQHVAAVVLDSTDTIVLTIFSTLSNVSVYSVYHIVVYGIRNIFLVITNGIQALLGELWAKQDSQLRNVFLWTEWLIHTLVVIAFGCTGVLILPFISIYTKGVTDANYIQPLFSILIICAHAFYCLRLPYHMMIKASGHYKETQSCYIIATVMNIVISIVTVFIWGLIGVAIGTLSAMLYQTVWMAWYNSKHLINREMKEFVKQVGIDFIVLTIGIASTLWIKLSDLTYYSWIVMAIEVLIIWIATSVFINLIFNKDRLLQLLTRIKKRLQHLS